MPFKNILLLAATRAEIDPLLNHYAITLADDGISVAERGNWRLHILISGVGMVNTAYTLGKLKDAPFAYCINAGIAGSFDKSIAMGEVMLITEDTLSEMGAEDGNQFIPWEQMGMGGETCFYGRTYTTLPASFAGLKRVKGITVNTVHGNENSIAHILKRLPVQTESMEGAAFFRASAHLSGTVLQIRAISNYVEKRNRSKWNIPLAITQLNNTLIQFLDELNH